MTTTHSRFHPAPTLSGNYDLRPLDTLDLQGAQVAQVGVVRVAQGMRSPPEGLRVSARHEIAYIVAGQVRAETEHGTRIVGAGDVIVSSPAELHAFTALVDATIFFVVIDPPIA